jgi:hypothetical protein
MLKKVKAKVKKPLQKIKKGFVNKKTNEKRNIFKYLEERYKDKIKLVFLINADSKKISELLKENNIVVYKKDKTIFGRSKNCRFQAKLVNNFIYLAEIENISKNKNSLRNLYEIKKFNDFLINYSRKEGYPEIRIDTWIFEQFSGFSKYLGGFKIDNINEMRLYRRKLKLNNVDKVLSYDFKFNRLECLTNNGDVIYLETFLPLYVLKV